MFISAQKYKNNPFCNCLVLYSVFSYSVFFLNPYMDEGVKNPEERDWVFCNVFFIIILYIYI